MRSNVFGILRKLFPVLLLSAAGCFAPSPEKSNFDTVSNHLERGGSVYTVRQTAPLKNEIKCWLESAENAVKSSEIPQQRKILFRRTLTAAELIWELSGLNDISGWGESSVPLKNNPFYSISNRIFVAIPQNSQGFINDIFPEKNQDATEIIAALPAEIDVAAGVYLEPEAIMTALKKSGPAGVEFLKTAASVIPWHDWLAGCKGWWVSGMIFPETADLRAVKWYVDIPDSEKKVFSYISAAFVPLVLKKDDENRLTSTPLMQKSSGGLSLTVTHKPGRTIFYFGSEKFFTGTGMKKLSSLPGYNHIVPYKKVEAVAFAIAPDPEKTPAWVSQYRFSGFELHHPENSAADNFFSLIRREKDGFLFAESANKDNQIQKFTLLCLDIPEFLLPEKLEFFNAFEREKEKQAHQELERTLKSKKCFIEYLPAIREALKKYSEKNNGNYPDRPGFEGFQQLVNSNLIDMKILNRGEKVSGKTVSMGNCDYLYFGNINAPDVQRVLAIDLPGNHNDTFHVLYDDSSKTIVEYKLERAGSCRRIISYLHTVNFWPEEYFFKLMKQAEIFDGELAKQKGRK